MDAGTMIGSCHSTITLFAVALLVQLTVYGVVDAEYVVVRHHFVHDHFYPNRCGVVGYNCCAGKEECKSSNNTQGLCVQHRTTDGHCYTRKCVPKCQYGYVCTNTNLCMKINHVGVVIVALIATVVSIVIAIIKIKKINKESKVSVTAIIPLNDEDGERSGAAKSVTKDSMASLSPLKKVREQYGAGSREYQSAMMSIRGIR